MLREWSCFTSLPLTTTFGRNGCWEDYYTTKPLTLILSSFTFQHLFLPILWGSTFFYLMLDVWVLCHVFSTFDLVETCQVVSLLVHRKELQVVTSANGAVSWLGKMAKSLFNISFLFLFFSFITKVEHGKISCDSHRVTKM